MHAICFISYNILRKLTNFIYTKKHSPQIHIKKSNLKFHRYVISHRIGSMNTTKFHHFPIPPHFRIRTKQIKDSYVCTLYQIHYHSHKCIRSEIRAPVAVVHRKTEHCVLVAKKTKHIQRPCENARPVSPRSSHRVDVSLHRSLQSHQMTHHVLEEFRRDEEAVRLQDATSEGRGS